MGINDMSLCNMCNSEDDSIEHTLLFCKKKNL